VANLDLSQACLSVPVTNAGCPIQADFGLSGIHGPRLLTVQGLDDPLQWRKLRVSVRWNPTQAKIGLNGAPAICYRDGGAGLREIVASATYGVV
jgi:hypothetical protein